MASIDLTIVILTFNEEKHIERCINSIKELSTDIVVIDSFSNDQTVSIAKSLGARVYQNPWVNHAVQFQWGLDNTDIKSEWIMRLDADEYLEDSHLIISEKLKNLSSEVTGVHIRRKIYFLGQWIKHGAIYPIYTLRIWRNGSGRIENRWMDEHIVLTCGYSISLNVNIVDDNKNPISWWVDKHNSYATKEMLEILNLKYSFMPVDESLLESGRSSAKIKRLVKDHLYNNIPLFVRPGLYFLYRYIFRLGFLDKSKGYAFHYMQGYWYRSLVDLKVLEAEELLQSINNPDQVKKALSDFTGLKL